MKTYEKYKNSGVSWLGKIPEHWEIRRAKQFFYSRKDINRNYQCNNILSLTLKGVVNNNAERPIGLSPTDYATYQIFERNNLVFKLIDLENISTSRVGLVHERGIMSPAYVRLINRYECNMKYFYFQYYDLYLRNIYNGLGAGVRSTLSTSDLLNMLIIIPPLSEQNAIVKFLDYKISRIEKLISIRQRQISELKELKKAVINKAVTKGDWKRVRLKRVAKLNPTCSFQGIKPEDEVTFAPMECIRTDRRIEINATLSKNNSSYNSFNEGDIALAKVTPCFENGNVCIMENLTRGYAFGSSELFNIRPFNIKPRYLLYYLMTDFFKNGGIVSMTGSAGLKRVSATYIQNALVPVPPISEQNEISKYLDKKCTQIDKLITILEKQITELNELKARLISDAVTGKIDVR